ncbi:MAG: hypothetical protein K0R65_2537 [Crocinitomicaceae bacterium]|jgi:hypothetical protein|nr:hypothetical protein [Crocinitomicaceae bacterium]
MFFGSKGATFYQEKGVNTKKTEQKIARLLWFKL